MNDPNREHFLLHLSSHAVQSSLQALGIQTFAKQDPQYPALLKEIHDPPFVLFSQGTPRNDLPYIAVVGTRKPTAYGISCTQTMVRTLVAAGYGIVSGLAHGIDSVAHQAALDAGGHTVAVIAHGHAQYTAREAQLARNIIAKGGAILTEHLPHVHAEKFSFPVRNRIIAGIAQATLIPEATLKSGTLITASCAIRENRDVFAIPGLITNPNSEGPHTLIASGAACIYSSKSLLHALGLEDRVQTQQMLPMLSKEAQYIVSALSASAQHIDDLLDALSIPLGALMGELNALIKLDMIEEKPGSIYALKPR